MFKTHTLFVSALGSLLALSACGGVSYQEDEETERRVVLLSCEELDENACEHRTDCAPLYTGGGCPDIICEPGDPCPAIACEEGGFDGCVALPEPSTCESDADCAPNQFCEYGYQDEPTGCACPTCLEGENCPPCDCVDGPPAQRDEPARGYCEDRYDGDCTHDAECGPNGVCVYNDLPVACDCAECPEDALCEPCDCAQPEPVGFCEYLEEEEFCTEDADCRPGSHCELSDYDDAECICAEPGCAEGDDECEDWGCDCGGSEGICVPDRD